MKIASLEPILLDPTLLVRLETDGGIVGWGECSPMNTRVTQSHLKHSIKPLVVGRDPFNLESIVEDIFVKTYKIAGQSQAMAASGVEIALWDIIGKSLEVPIYKLIGGAYRKKVRVYASSMRRDISPKEEADRMTRLVDDHGFTAVKVRVGQKFGFNRDAAPGRSEAVVREVRSSLGEGVEIMVDANSCYTAKGAIKMGRRLEKYDIFHFEEPCPYKDLDSTAKVAAALDTPVAGGEQDWEMHHFRRMMEMGAVDIVQPDLIKAGGFLICKKIAAMAESFGLVCTPHQTQPLGTIANLHFVASTPCCRYSQEFNIESHPWRERLFGEQLRVKDGFLPVPQEPGLGIEINEDLLPDPDL